MLKIIKNLKVSLFLCFNLFIISGCTGLYTTDPNITYERLTDKIVLEKNLVTLENYIKVVYFGADNDNFGSSKTIGYEFKKYTNNQIYFIVNNFSNISFSNTLNYGANHPVFFREILFSNGENVTKIIIENSSIVRETPIQLLNKDQEMQLKKIFNSNLPITLRIYTNIGEYDLKFDNQFKENQKEFFNYTF